jgi:hypothetical protein
MPTPGDDITEAIPYVLSNPSTVLGYSPTGEAYDISVNGLPFFLSTSDELPYRRQTAQYRKQQIDQANEPGEQSITGWWVRAQSSFHLGEGIRFFDPTAGETIPYRFTDSKGVNVWDKGQVTLLKSCSSAHVVTGAINSTTNRPFQTLRSIQWSGINGTLLLDEYDVDKVFPAITVSISNKALTSNVATLTTTAAHGLSANMQITITGVDATFNGTYRITGVPTTTTFTYAKTASNVTSAAVSPVGTGVASIIHFIDYNAGAGVYPVYAICDDGTNAYWLTNVTAGGSTKLTMYKKPLTGSSASTADEVKMFDVTGMTITANSSMEFVKERIVACIDNKVYEIPTNATALTGSGGGRLVYTHTTSTHVYTSITASGPAIYISGYNGIQSTISKFTLEAASGQMPALTSAAVAAELPVGEIVYKIYYYLGFMIIGTSKGIRVAQVNDQDGSIIYGPLIVETSQPVYDVAARGNFVWCATGVDGEPGTIRMNLAEQVETLRFAYANDVYFPGVTDHPTTGCAFAGSTNQLMFCTTYAAGTDGAVYYENASTLMPSGYIQTGGIRYGTLENKVFKNIKARMGVSNGALTMKSIDANGVEYSIGYFAEGEVIPEVGISYPLGSQEYLSFKFIFERLSTDSTKGPTFKGYQLKSLPAVPRQRIIQYPLACYDRESDTYGVQVGYEGWAYSKLVELENVENSGDTIRIVDYRNNESYLGVIEEMQFINRTPSDKRFSGFGGILLLTIRTL